MQVEAVGVEVERLGHRAGHADVEALRARAGGAEVVGLGPVVLDPLVPLVLLPGEEVAGAARRHPVAYDGGVQVEERRGVDEELVATGDGVVDEVVPARVCLDLLAVGEHVGVVPVEDVALRGERAEVARVGATPAVLDPDQPRVVGTDLGELLRRRALVVDDDDLEQVRGIGLRGEAGEHVGKGALVVEGRDDDGHRQCRLPVTEGRRREAAPVVVAHHWLRSHLAAHPPSAPAASGRSSGSTSSARLGWKPCHSEATMSGRRNSSSSRTQVCPSPVRRRM